MHLKLDKNVVDKEYKVQVIQLFVKRCMDQLKGETEDAADKRGIVQLLSTFLDRYEGIRPLKPEMASLAARLPNIKPLLVQVTNAMDPDNRIPGQVQMTFFQTFGFLRKQIAEHFGLEINQFGLYIKNK